MAKNVKNDWLGGRVDGDLKEEVEAYIEDAKITQGDLIRAAVKEYMNNHPVTDKE